MSATPISFLDLKSLIIALNLVTRTQCASRLLSACSSCNVRGFSPKFLVRLTCNLFGANSSNGSSSISPFLNNLHLLAIALTISFSVAATCVFNFNTPLTPTYANAFFFMIFPNSILSFGKVSSSNRRSKRSNRGSALSLPLVRAISAYSDRRRSHSSSITTQIFASPTCQLYTCSSTPQQPPHTAMIRDLKQLERARFTN
mmetsp:Transcript_3973/g.5794  ORF Transcript_3973/g.5794 Transcript_3973/m.5794 type:complete len:201 (-) Transcript_3973:216-818(-)